MSRYTVIYALFALTVGMVDVTAGQGLGNSFAVTSLCGPVWAWLAALFLPAETIQTRLTSLVSGNE